jgi:Uma2 family endonuclease
MLQIPEVWIIDRDTRQPEVYRLGEADYQLVAPDRDGWIVSGIAAVHMRAEHGKLAIAIVENPASFRLLPEE